MSSAGEGRHLLFGVLALQLDFIDRGQLIAATSDWIQDKSAPLEEVLVRRGYLTEAERQTLADVVAKHLARHGGDVEVSLSSLPAAAEVTEEIAKLSGGLAVTIVTPAKSAASKGDQTQVAVQVAEPTVRLRYRKVRFHAAGGLGEVSVAFDDELQREVALKEMKSRASESQDSRDRFVGEAEITGRLEHPGVVPVYSLGRFADGRPYYVMRFIRGATLKDAIKRFHGQVAAADRQLELSRLLRRFIDVCYTIEYAHSRGVLHRDIKPDNIMLGSFDETLVVDWGLARPLDHGEEISESKRFEWKLGRRSGSSRTIDGSVVGTPAYMSPEQAAGHLNELSTVSDVFSLGATLYCLLTGQPPQVGRDSYAIVQRVISGEFAKPRDVRADVPRALEAICLKAMAHLPGDRYGSAAELADDVERWLADEPVAAYQESFVERAGRWARRHRALVQAGTIALTCIAGVAIAAAVLINGARRREATAKQQAFNHYLIARNSVDRNVTGVNEALRFAPGMAAMRERLLAAAAGDYQRFADFRSGDPELELERGRAKLRLGEVQAQLGKTSAASEAFHSAEVHFEDLQRSFPAVTDAARVEQARSLMRRGGLLADQDDPGALELWRAAARLIQKPMNVPATEDDRRLVLAAAHVSLAEWFEQESKTADAREHLASANQALELSVSKGYQRTPEVAEQFSRNQLGVWRLAARMDTAEGKWTAARQALDRAIAASEPWGRVDSANPAQYLDWADLQVESCGVLRKLGQTVEELSALGAAIGAYRTLHETALDSPVYRESLALTLIDRAAVWLELQRPYEAKSDLGDALPMLQHLASEQRENSIYRYKYAMGLEVLGRLYHLIGDDADARTDLEEAVQRLTALAEARPDGGYREQAAVARSQLARTLAALGQPTNADHEFEQARSDLAESLSVAPNQPELMVDLAWLQRHWGSVLWDRNEPGLAAEHYRESLDLWKKVISQWPSPAYERACADLLANCPIIELRDASLALEMARQAALAAPSSPLAQATLAGAFYRAGQSKEAIAALETARDQSVPLAQTYLLRAMLLHDAREPVPAQQVYDAGVAKQRYLVGDNDLRRLLGDAAACLGLKAPD